MFLFGPLKPLFHQLKQKHTCLPSFIKAHELINVIARTSDVYQYRAGFPEMYHSQNQIYKKIKATNLSVDLWYKASEQRS